MMKTLNEILGQKMKIELGGRTFEICVTADSLKKVMAIPDEYLKLQQELEEGKITELMAVESLEEIIRDIWGPEAVKSDQGEGKRTLDYYAALTISLVKQMTAQLMRA